MDELSDEDKLVVTTCSSCSSSSYHKTSTLLNSLLVSQVLTYLLKKRLEVSEEILEGKYDHLPEDAFRLVGRIEDVIENAKRMGVEV